MLINLYLILLISGQTLKKICELNGPGPTTAQVEPRAARGWRFGESETAPPPVRAAAAADPARLLDDLSPRPLGVARCGAQRQAGCPPPTSAARQSVALAVTADE